jgi:cysteine-rich repeat protein
MRTIALALLATSSLSCSVLIRLGVERCESLEPACEENILVVCSSEGLVVRTDCGAETCNATLVDCSPCGNGLPDEGEECDDGNDTQGDGCENDCTLPACGNGIVDSIPTVDADGDGDLDVETCDDGAQNVDLADRCRTVCQLPFCGDAIQDTGEECDDGDADHGNGNQNQPNACRTTCVNPTCGDGIVDFEDIINPGEFDPGEGEACDDGNNINDDGCNFDPFVPPPPFVADERQADQCNQTFPTCDNGNARELNAIEEHELCFDRAQTVLNLGNGSGVIAVVANDFNNDFKSDIVVVEGNQGDGVLTVFRNLNDGNGTMVQGASFSVTPGIDPTAIIAVDLNGDFKRDLITTNQGSNLAGITVLLNTTADTPNADITFGAAAGFAAGSGAVALAAGDIDGNGAVDIVVTNQGADTINILFGNGNGTFGNPQQQTAGDKPVAVAIGDIDDDSDNDIIVANENGDSLTIFESSGGINPTFTARTISVGDGPTSIAIGDLEADGDLDLVTSNVNADTMSILLNNNDGTFVETVQATDDRPQSVFVGDINHDDTGADPLLLEIVVANEGADTISIFRAKESAPGTYSPALNLRVGNAPISVSINDFDANTYFDITVANNQDNSVSVLFFTP